MSSYEPECIVTIIGCLNTMFSSVQHLNIVVECYPIFVWWKCVSDGTFVNAYCTDIWVLLSVLLNRKHYKLIIDMFVENLNFVNYFFLNCQYYRWVESILEMKNKNNDKNWIINVPGLNKYQCLLNLTCTKVEMICNSGQQF